jgi:hypothetical protein
MANTKKAADKPTIKADGQNQMSTAAAEQSEDVQEAETKGSKSTAQTGMEPGPTPREQRDKLNAEFEKANEKGKAAIIDETQVGLQVRGY